MLKSFLFFRTTKNYSMKKKYVQKTEKGGGGWVLGPIVDRLWIIAIVYMWNLN